MEWHFNFPSVQGHELNRRLARRWCRSWYCYKRRKKNPTHTFSHKFTFDSCVLWNVCFSKKKKKHRAASCILFLFNCAISFQKLRNKGHIDCASPDPEDCFGHSPLMDDHFGKLSEESDLMYKRCGVSTFLCPPAILCWFLSLCWCSLQALNKKEHRGCDSPDPDASYVLTPHTEEKYKKINEEFDNMMRNHKIVSTVNAVFLLGFVAQKDFHSFFCHLTFSCFCYLPPSPPKNFCQLLSELL